MDSGDRRRSLRRWANTSRRRCMRRRDAKPVCRASADVAQDRRHRSRCRGPESSAPRSTAPSSCHNASAFLRRSPAAHGHLPLAPDVLGVRTCFVACLHKSINDGARPSAPPRAWCHDLLDWLLIRSNNSGRKLWWSLATETRIPAFLLYYYKINLVLFFWSNNLVLFFWSNNLVLIIR